MEGFPLQRRRLHAGHFGFMRAVVQGIDAQAGWNRYLRIEGEYSDIRNVRKTIAWLRDEFAAAARRSNRFGTARLVLIDIASLGADDGGVPSLETFAAKVGMEDFSEAEQLEAYRSEFGTITQRQSRRARLIAKQLDALRVLELLAAQQPASGDPVAAWLHPDLATKLEAAGFFTLRALVETINGKGKRWWFNIRAIGEHKAARIEEWLRTHEDSIGLAIGAHVRVARRTLQNAALQAVVPRETGVVPIDKLIVPAALNGSDGHYRSPRHLCMLNADNDYEALLIWIKSRQSLTPEEIAIRKTKRRIDPAAPQGPSDWLQYLSHTQRAYLKEAERFLLWSVVERQKPLSSMSLEDCEAYRAFIANPLPAERWCGPYGGVEKWSSRWRPFTGPLSPAAQRHAIVILKSFYGFLVDQCYLVGNPWNGVTRPGAPHAKAARGRSFSPAQWAFLMQQLKGLAASSANHRLAFALQFLYATGLRLHEVMNCKLGDFHFVSYPPDDGESETIEGFEVRVIGKGGKLRIVSVPDETMAVLSSYLASRGLEPHLEALGNQDAYLLGRVVDLDQRAPWSAYAKTPVDPKAGIAGSTLYDQLKRFFQQCAAVLAASDLKGAERLRAASTHWLRHTHASHAIAADVPLDVVQDRLGHASPATTMIYATSEDRRKMKAMRKMFGITK